MSSKISPYPSDNHNISEARIQFQRESFGDVLAKRHRRSVGLRALPATVLLLIFASVQPASAAGQEPVGKPRVLAYVGDVPITIADVDFQLGRSTSGNESLPELPSTVLNSTIELIALQRQALATMRKSKQAASVKAVDRWLEANPPANSERAVKPTAQQIVEAVSQQTAVTEETYRDFVAFRLSWPRYLKRHLTESNVSKHFRNQTARFDGSQFEIELASLAVPPGQSDERTEAEKKLSALRDRLLESESEIKELSLSDEIVLRERGWVRGTGDLDPTIIDGVLLLTAGELSKPVHTATGVHLLRLYAVRAGDRQLDAVRDDVRAHMLLFLLKHLASQSQAEMPLVFSPT